MFEFFHTDHNDYNSGYCRQSVVNCTDNVLFPVVPEKIRQNIV